MKHLLFIVLTMLAAAGSADVLCGEPLKVRIAVASGGHGFNSMGGFMYTRQALIDHFGEDRIVIYDHLRAPDLLKLIREDKVDYFISTSGITRRFMPEGSKELLTVASPRFPDPNRSFGTVFLVRRDSSIHSIEDMKGKRFVTNQPYGPYSYLIGMAEIEKHGFRQDRFFKSKTFLMKSPREVITSVLNGDFDVGSVASCTLEDLYPPDSRERTELRAVAPKASEPCIRSTEQYPNWAFSSVAGASPDLTREIVMVLLTMKRPPSGAWWGFATDYVNTDDAFRILQIGVYDVLKERSFKEFITKYWPYAALLLLLVVLGFTLSAVLQKMVRDKTADLQKALDTQIRMRNETELAEERYRKLERVGLIGQLSAMFAHEIRQPIGAISAYAAGLRYFDKTDTLSRDMLLNTLEKIEEQAERAESIVDRVQSYAKNERGERRLCDIAPIIGQALKLFGKTGRFKGTLKSDIAEGVIAKVDPLELQIALLNLLKNASDALSKKHSGAEIRVTLRTSGNQVEIIVEDNGAPLTRDALKQMQAPLTSTKQNGLGIGLVLVRSIALRLGGRLTLDAPSRGGLIAVLSFPIVEKNDCTETLDSDC